MENGVKLGFVCVQNAGRSRMAAAFAEREREARGVEDAVEILTGGTDPETVRAIREEVERRVSDLFEESVGEA